jgi:hypothetical protein
MKGTYTIEAKLDDKVDTVCQVEHGKEYRFENVEEYRENLPPHKVSYSEYPCMCVASVIFDDEEKEK